MNRGQASPTTPRGRSPRTASHPSYPKRHMSGTDGAFSDNSFSSRDGMWQGRRARSHRASSSSFPRHRPATDCFYRPKITQGPQQDHDASNSSYCESNQLESSVASNSVPEAEGNLIACSSSHDTFADEMKTQIRQTMLDDNGTKIERSSLQNESQLQLSLHSGNKDQPSQEQYADSTVFTGNSVQSERPEVIKPFDICIPKTENFVMLKPSLFDKNRQKRNQINRALKSQGNVLRPGMVLLKGYLAMDDQVKIVRLCRDLGCGDGGFYQPGYTDGGRLHLKMMCLGWNWDPNTGKYGEFRPFDGAKPPQIPYYFNWLVDKAMKDSCALIERNSKAGNAEYILPWMSPDICIVNFYSKSGRLGLHQDKDESERSLNEGLPVVSFSIGDAGEFLYSDNRDETNAEKVLLESGDVLIFGGKSRHVFHSVSSIRPNTAPTSLLEETSLHPGRLNLTFRKY